MTEFEDELLCQLRALTMAVQALAENHARQMNGEAAAYSSDTIELFVAKLERGQSIASDEVRAAP